MRRIEALLVCLAMAAATGPAMAELKPGDTVPDATFKDMRYLPRTLSELGEAKATVLFFQTNTCPLAQRYMPKLVELEKAYAEQGVIVAGVNVGVDETIQQVAYHALEYGATFPMLKDMTGETAKQLGITRTPEVLVYDAERVLRYRGRVDDQYRLGGVRPEPTREDLRAALDEILAGQAVSVPETTPEGCALTLFKVPEPETEVTWSEHIAPIIQNSCLPCHRAGGISFALENYKQASARADMLAEVVHEERMPPWYAHPEFGEFENSRRLAAADKTKILQWVEAGMPEGDPAKAPPLPTFDDTGWKIQPDLIIESKQTNAIPATGFIPYTYQFFPYEFPEDTWIQGIEIKPSNPRVVHHANLVYTAGGFDFNRDENFLYGTVPGGMPAHLDEGRAIFIPKGSRLAIQIHYVTTGKVEQDRIAVGLRYAKEPIRKRMYYSILEDDTFAIPAGSRAHKVVDEVTMDNDVTAIALFSHMHLRGRDMSFYAHYPDGTSELLMTLPNYNFNWQLTYMYPPDTKRLPKGTRIECVAHYDNSPFNPYNPDPTVVVKDGPQTVDEMHNGFFIYTKDEENLNIAINPETGQAVAEVAAGK